MIRFFANREIDGVIYLECRLRKLEQKDAPFMFEWMHNQGITSGLMKDFGSMTIEHCRNFIEESKSQKNDIHLAIADADDEYMGTVSLKHIKNGCAEFAIVVREKAQGKGYAMDGMHQIVEYGLNVLGLNEIYWNVLRTNKRAVRFYEKNRYKRIVMTYEEQLQKGCHYTEEDMQKFDWFQVGM